MNLISAQNYDVVIVGGGVAGAAAAIRLAQDGASVLLVEKQKFPRHKLCGEFISPEALTRLQNLGVLERMLAKGGARLTETVFYAPRGGRGARVKSAWFGALHSFALSLSRAEMDAQLLARARAVGVKVCEETLLGELLFADGSIKGAQLKHADGTRRNVTASIWIDATGRAAALVRQTRRAETKNYPAETKSTVAERDFGAEKKRAPLVAFKTHLRNARGADDACEIYFYRGGYGGLSRIENDLWNLCFIVSAEDARAVASDPARAMREIVMTNTRAARTLSAAEIHGAWHAVAIESFGQRAVAPYSNLLCIGDAAAFIDPFTGSGMLLALESAELAANCVGEHLRELQHTENNLTAEHVTAKYRQRHAARFAARLRVCSWLRRAAFAPRLATAAVHVFSLSAGLRRQLAQATRRAPTNEMFES